MKYLFPTPVVYDGNDARFLQRDGARFARECIAMGHVGMKLILEGSPNLGHPSSPLLQTASYRDWCDSDFWRRQSADGILLYGGYARCMPPVARAIRAADIPLALKMDDAIGLVRFPSNASAFFSRHYWKSRQTHFPVRALVGALLRLAVWPVRSRRQFLVSYLEHFDAVLGESKLCIDNTRDFLLWAKRSDLADRLAVMPHPVLNEFNFGPDNQPKRNVILAVALNWRDPLKRGRLLGRSLKRFLPKHPEWGALVIGDGSDFVAQEAGVCRARIDTLSALPPEELLPRYRSAKIFAMPSGAESFPIVVMEALCCGCSVVFPPELPALAELVEARAATRAARSTPAGMADALSGECRAWETGFRDPVTTARQYGNSCHVHSSMERLVALFAAARHDKGRRFAQTRSLC